MRNYRLFVIGFFSFVFVSGCAPSMGLRMPAPEVVLEDAKESSRQRVLSSNFGGIKVKVLPFMDGRSSDVFAVVDGRDVFTDGEIGVATQTGFERQVREAGARVALLHAPTIEGEVVEWRAKVVPNLPASEVVSKAKIRVSVRDVKTKEVYRAVYSGESNRKHPLLDEDDVRRSLGFAMASAINAAQSDDQLREAMRGAQR